MTPVKMTAAEILAVKNNANVRQKYIDEIVDKTLYHLTVTSGDVTWAKNRHWSAEIQANPDLLFNDSTLPNVFEFNMLARDFDMVDTDTVGDAPDQFVAYMNDGDKWNYVVDDYFANKANLFLM